MKNSFLLFSRLRVVLLTLAMLSGFSFVSAQTKTISGTVTAAGLPIPGVNVKVKGGNAGAVTDFDGLYTIDAEIGEILQFSSIGFGTQSITVGDVSKIDVVLVEDVEVLDDVVVIGYGTVKKSDLTGSVVSVKAEEIEKKQPVSFEQALVGSAPGVRVVAGQGGPGEGFKVRVRGTTSLLANADPLYVIDGFAILEEDGNGQDVSNGGGSSFVSPLAGIDPSTIESIEVLKDASATAIYGARGANGVVIVTTKSGKKGKPSLTLDTSVGVSGLSRQIDLLGPQDYINFFNDLNTINPGAADTRPFFFRDQISANALSTEDLPVIRARDQAFKEAFIQKYSLGVRGGSEKTRYSANFSYLDQEGIIVTTDFQRYAANIKTTSNVTNKLKVDFLLNASLLTRNGVVNADTGSNNRVGFVGSLLRRRPVEQNRNINILDAGNSEDIDGDGVLDIVNGRILPDPLRTLSNVNQTNIINARSSVSLSYKFLDNLTFSTTFAGRIGSNEGRAFFDIDFGRGRATDGLATRRSSQSFQYQNNNTLKYNNKIGKHKYDILLGYTQEQASSDNFSTESVNFVSNRVNLDQLDPSTPRRIRSNAQNSTVNSGIFRANYSYDNRYLLTATGRVDETSRFIDNVGYFPSASAKWKVSNEGFFKKSKLKPIINNLALKASYGVTGNDRIPFARSRTSIELSPILGERLISLSNSDLTWESTAQLDFGLELAFFKNKITFEADYFDKTTTDLLFQLPVSSIFGLGTAPDRASIFTNLGEITNTGLELSLNINVVNTKNFKWKTQANITFSDNEIIDSGEGGDLILSSTFQQSVIEDFIVAEGEDVGAFYGFRSAGVYRFEDFVEFDGLNEQERAILFRQGGNANGSLRNNNGVNGTLGDSTTSSFTLKPGVQRDERVANYRPGLRKYRDLDGDGVVTAANDREVLGSSQPDHFGGFTNNFTIMNNFDLSFQFNWSYGNEILNKNIFLGTRTNLLNGNLFPSVLNRWTPFNNDTDVPSLRGLQDVASGRQLSDDSFVEDASFLRLNNISFGYRLPTKNIKAYGLNQLKIYGSINNVYVWTNYSGFDPETSIGRGLTSGIDFDAFPRARTFVFGVRASF